MIQVGGQRHEAGAGKPIGDLLDMWNQTPPFLNHDDARTWLTRPRQITGSGVPV